MCGTVTSRGALAVDSGPARSSPGTYPVSMPTLAEGAVRGFASWRLRPDLDPSLVPLRGVTSPINKVSKDIFTKIKKTVAYQ